MKRDGLELFFSIMLMFFSGFPLIELLSKSLAIDQISNFSLIVIVIWLVVILISSIIYFVSYWMEECDQLHVTGTVSPVPEIYQVRGLPNSSSLYKITSWRASYFVIVTDVLTVSKVDVKHNMKLLFGLVAQLVRATDS